MRCDMRHDERTPMYFMRLTSSLYLWYESAATSPLALPFEKSGRVCVILSQMLGPFPAGKNIDNHPFT
ncbi:unnamed protein product, partial [Nesidiocoris tenuis]